MRVVIVEDSRLARLELKELLRAHPALTLVGEAANVPDAKVLIEQQQPDLLLLDIDLAGDSAFDLLAQLVFIPRIIFTTAFAEHALAAFDYPTVDYLLKPVSSARLAQAIAKLPTLNTADDHPPEAAPDASRQRASARFGRELFLSKTVNVVFCCVWVMCSCLKPLAITAKFGRERRHLWCTGL